MWQAVIHWLLTPLSGASEHALSPWVSWHGRTMVLAWSVLLPLGVMLARFFKMMPGQDWPQVLDKKIWWYGHLALQYGGVACMVLGLYLILGGNQDDSAVARVHARLGWLVSVLGCLQVFSGWLRGTKGGPTEPQLRGDHYDMSKRRVRFEWVHKCGGYAALLLAFLATATGLFAADAPRWMVLVLSVWWATLMVFWMIWQRQGRCIDTWQAVWGPNRNPSYPLVGWGIRLYSAEQWQKRFSQRAKDPGVGWR